MKDYLYIKESLTIFWKRRDLLIQLIVRNVESRYKGSILGIAWSFIQPLIMLSIYTFVFSIVFQAKFGAIPNDNRLAFAVILFSGMSVFGVFADSVTGCSYLINSNQNYVKKVVFPLELLPVSHVAGVIINSIPSFLLVAAGMLICGDPFQFSWTILLLPLTIIPLWLFTLGVSYLITSLAVYIRDLAYVIGLFCQILFFMTPIFYPIDGVPQQFRWILELNPLSALVENTRALLLYGKLPELQSCSISILLSIVVFQLGYIWFRKTKKGFADVL